MVIIIIFSCWIFINPKDIHFPISKDTRVYGAHCELVKWLFSPPRALTQIYVEILRYITGVLLDSNNILFLRRLKSSRHSHEIIICSISDYECNGNLTAVMTLSHLFIFSMKVHVSISQTVDLIAVGCLVCMRLPIFCEFICQNVFFFTLCFKEKKNMYMLYI